MRPLYSLTICTIILLCVSFSDCFAWYRLVAKNGGANGYNISDVRYDFWGTSVWCEGAGYEKLPTEAFRDGLNKRWIDSKDQSAVDFAMNQMRIGIKEGKIKMHTGKIVWWKKTPTEMCISVD